MSNERVLCTFLGGIKRDQIHDLNRLFKWDAPQGKFVPDAAALPDVAKNIGDMIGYLNKAEREQYPDGGPPVPTPEPFVPLKEFKPGDPRFVFTSQRTPVSAIPFHLPATWSDPWGKAAASENGTGGTGFSEAAISTTPGDMTGFTGSGSNLTIDFKMGEGIFQPGALVYYNHRMGDGHAPRGTGFSVEFPKP